MKATTSQTYLKTVMRVNSPAGIAGAYNFTLASFGGTTVGINLTADAVFVQDATAPATDGCEALTNTAQLNGKIALIDRGNCEFGLKCLKAQQAGAIAVIVFNNVAGAGTVTMSEGAVGSQVTIPCVVLRYEDGQTIRAALTPGPVNIGFIQEAEVTAALTNNGIIEYPQGNPIPNVINHDLIVAPITTCGTATPALQIGDANSFTVGSNWYKESTLTNIAGTYTPNTFTVTNLAAFYGVIHHRKRPLALVLRTALLKVVMRVRAM